ncbi:hypothetical protein ABZU86_13605 [Streptomyces sp. NPDC005271]|uniref:hypothetical protein n=1 Tax=unclassified Streptomyces TaxID=2593676 RepID=UPI0033A8268D
MTTDPNAPRRDQDVRLYLLLIALAVIVLAVAGLVYVTYQHPALTGPLSVGWTAAAALMTALGFAITRR